jgi:hypothetical protein
MLGTRLEGGGMAPTPNTDPGTLSEPTGQAWEPRSLVAAITEPCGFDPDMRKPLSEYLRLGAIPDGGPEAQRLARRAKGYLIHDDELYYHSTSGILQQCIPIGEGKALLLNIHEGICGHHTSSRSMVGKAFR